MRLIMLRDPDAGDTITINGVGRQVTLPVTVPEYVNALQVYDDFSEAENSDLTNNITDQPPAYVQDLITAWEDAAPPKPPEPTAEELLEAERSTMVVSKFQAKAALYQSGMLETVQTHMETADPMAQMAWEDAQEFRRYSPTMNALAVELGMTEEQLDDLFRLAATIEA